MPVVAYVNTSVAVKAEADMCCTSGNARPVVESFGTDRVIMLPEEYLAHNIAAQTGVRIISLAGHCEVHERFTAAEEVRELRRPTISGVVILAHPECPPEVVAEAATIPARPRKWPRSSAATKPARVVLIDRVLDERQRLRAASRGWNLIRPLQFCARMMKTITLAENPPCAGEHATRGDDRPGAGRAGALRSGTDAGAVSIAPLPLVMIEPLVRAALLEDLGRAGDITTDAIVPAAARAETALVARQAGVVAGLDFSLLAFRLCDPAIEALVERPDGDAPRRRAT